MGSVRDATPGPRRASHFETSGWPPNDGVLAARKPRLLRAWSPAPAVRISLWLNALSGAAVALHPDVWPYMLGLLGCNHAVLTSFMHPRSGLLGPNIVRLPACHSHAIALTFDDGPDPEITPRVLDLLDVYKASASFFVIGDRAARYPALVREIVRRGHTIENHTQSHSVAFAARGPWALRREIAAAQRTIADAAGVAPRFFRAPMGLRSPLLDPVLALEGLALVHWTRRGYDTQRREPRMVLDRLTRRLAARDILLLHDGSSASTTEGQPVVLEVLPALLGRIAAAGLNAMSLASLELPRAGYTGAGAAATSTVPI
jgi:peptidoglycan-N-acetylglucosamine deacetylase